MVEESGCGLSSSNVSGLHFSALAFLCSQRYLTVSKRKIVLFWININVIRFHCWLVRL